MSFPFVLRTARSIGYFTAVLVIGTALPAIAVPIVNSGNGHAYDVVAANLSWTAASAAAAQLTPPIGFSPGHLVTYSDAGEESFVLSNFSDATLNGNWIGLSDAAIEGEWRWIDDTPGIWQDPDSFASPVQTAHTNWRTGIDAEPNNEGDEDFAVYSTFSAPGPVWNDLANSSGFFNGYVVEYEPIPEPATSLLLGLALAGLAVLRGRHRKA